MTQVQIGLLIGLTGADTEPVPGDEVCVGHLDDEVKMIVHETECMNLPVRLGAGFGKRGVKAFVIEVSRKIAHAGRHGS